jgi:O-antigen/teichoic acid export membrane protein
MTDLKTTTLRQRILAAGSWTLTGFALGQLIRFGSNLFMSRLLVPEMFGVMAIAIIVMVGLAMFSDVGLRQCVVQARDGDEPDFLNTVWSVQILRGILLALVALVIGLLVAAANYLEMFPAYSVYSDPSLPYVIAAFSVTALIQGLESTKLLQASRDLSLRRVTQIELASQLVGLGCMLAWVVIDRSIWALVVNALSSTLARTIFSHLSLPGVPNRWHWDRQAFNRIIGFGKWIFLSSILGFLVNNGDRLILGGLVGSGVLGVYVIAFLIVSAIEGVLAKIIGGVAFPALSEIVRDRAANLKGHYYRLHSVIATGTYVITGVLFVSGQTVINLLYDQRYSDAGWMVQILAVSLFTVPFRTAMECFMALGKPQLYSNIIGFRLVALIAFLPLGFNLGGIEGALFGIVLSHFMALPIIVFFQIKFDMFDLKKELVLMTYLIVGASIGMMVRWLLPT